MLFKSLLLLIYFSIEIVAVIDVKSDGSDFFCKNRWRACLSVGWNLQAIFTADSFTFFFNWINRCHNRGCVANAYKVDLVSISPPLIEKYTYRLSSKYFLDKIDGRARIVCNENPNGTSNSSRDEYR